jgi:hypothetical protein
MQAVSSGAGPRKTGQNQHNQRPRASNAGL